jgi:hypothetical protein
VATTGRLRGVVIVASDKGPGIPDIALAMEDVYSTSRSLAACRREAKGFAFGTVWYRGKGEAGVESVRQRTGRGDDEPAVYQCGL